jgi:uncharacterized membrane protein (GlpM family)
MNASIKTTVTGALTILVAVFSAALGYFKTGTLPDFGTLIAAITAGIGLIAARDNNVTSEQAGAK